MANTMCFWNKVDRSGDVMTGDLTLGFNALKLGSVAKGVKLIAINDALEFFAAKAWDDSEYRCTILGELTVTNNINLGLGWLNMHYGGMGCAIKGSDVAVGRMLVRAPNLQDWAAIELNQIIAWFNLYSYGGLIAGGVDFIEFIKDLYHAKADSVNAVTLSGSTAETTLKSYTVPGGSMGANGALRIVAKGYSAGNNGQKTYRLKFGGLTLATLVQAAGVANRHWTIVAAIHNNGAVNAQVGGYVALDETVIENQESSIGTGIDTTADQVLAVTGQLANAADGATIHQFTVELNPT